MSERVTEAFRKLAVRMTYRTPDGSDWEGPTGDTSGGANDPLAGYEEACTRANRITVRDLVVRADDIVRGAMAIIPNLETDIESKGHLTTARAHLRFVRDILDVQVRHEPGPAPPAREPRPRTLGREDMLTCDACDEQQQGQVGELHEFRGEGAQVAPCGGTLECPDCPDHPPYICSSCRIWSQDRAARTRFA